MSTEPQDTHPKTARVLYDLLSKATPSRRLELGLALCDEALDVAQQAIARAHPELSALEQQLFFVQVTYGKELAERVRAYLARRSA